MQGTTENYCHTTDGKLKYRTRDLLYLIEVVPFCPELEIWEISKSKLHCETADDRELSLSQAEGENTAHTGPQQQQLLV